MIYRFNVKKKTDIVITLNFKDFKFYNKYYGI